MAIQLPSLNRISPQGPELSGRIDTNVANSAQATGQIAQSVSGVTNEVADYQEKVEEHAVQVAAIEAANKYEIQYRGALASAKKFQGDPSNIYSKIDEDSQKWQDDIIGENENASPRLQQAIREKITLANSSLRDKQATQHGLQYETYAKNITDSAVGLKAQGVLDSIETVSKDDPKSLIPAQIQIDDIKKLRVEEGRREGLVVTDDKGNENYSPILKMRILKDTSKSLKDAIISLNAAGKTDEAKMMMDKFGDDILSEDKTKLLGDHKDAQLQNKALSAVNDISYKYKDPVDQMKALDKISDLSVREKAQGILHTQQTRIEQAKEMAGKQTYEDLSNYVRNKKYVTVDEMKSDPFVKQMLGKDRMSQKQIDSLEEQVDAPKRSDVTTRGKMYDLMIKGDLSKMSYGEIQANSTGLNTSDRNKLFARWESDTHQSEPEKKQMITYMGGRLEKELQAAGAISKEFGRYSNSDEVKRTKALDSMMETIDSFPPGTSISEQDKWIRGYATSYLKGEVFKGLPQSKKFESAPTPKQEAKTSEAAPNPTTAASPQNTRQLTNDEKTQWLVKFRKVNGRTFSPKDGDNMQSFINSQGGKL